MSRLWEVDPGGLKKTNHLPRKEKTNIPSHSLFSPPSVQSTGSRFSNNGEGFGLNRLDLALATIVEPVKTVPTRLKHSDFSLTCVLHVTSRRPPSWTHPPTRTKLGMNGNWPLVIASLPHLPLLQRPNTGQATSRGGGLGILLELREGQCVWVRVCVRLIFFNHRIILSLQFYSSHITAQSFKPAAINVKVSCFFFCFFFLRKGLLRPKPFHRKVVGDAIYGKAIALKCK